MSNTIIPAYQIAELIRPEVSVDVLTGPSVAGTNDRIITRDIGGDSNPKYLRDTNLVKITIMAGDYVTGYNLARTVVDKVVGHPPVEQTDITYIRFVLLNGVNFLGVQDEAELQMWTMTIEVTSEPKTNPLTSREPIG